MRLLLPPLRMALPVCVCAADVVCAAAVAVVVVVRTGVTHARAIVADGAGADSARAVVVVGH